MSNILNQIKLSGVTYTIEDSTALRTIDDSVTSGGTNAVKGSGVYSAITASTAALAESINDMHYQTSGDVQNAISSKADTTAVTQAISEATSGKLDTSIFQTYSGNVDTALASKIAGASWDSNTSHLNFYDNVSATGTPLTYVDGADWVKDSFLKSVTIEDKEISGETVTCLVFVFETESGETETDIPLTDIFNPDNFYDKTEIDTIVSGITQDIEEATSGKADSSTVDTINNTLTAHTSNNDIHVTSSDKATWNGKQDALVSGTNIKTINGNSILGSGDLTVDTGLHAEVSGATLVFS